ncbi:MAG: hypothetical protein P9M05_12585 [Candidatus Stygibacter australis]|nr:hypothetical protein [Candidatus Stygibacter australis]
MTYKTYNIIYLCDKQPINQLQGATTQPGMTFLCYAGLSCGSLLPGRVWLEKIM